MQFFGTVMSALFDLPKRPSPRSGYRGGGRLSLALCCDLTVASSTARMSEIFTKRGLSVTAVSWLLPAWWVFIGQGIGLFRRHPVGRGGLGLRTGQPAGGRRRDRRLRRRLARRLAAGPPLALSMTKKLLNNSGAVSMAQALEDEARCQTVNFATSDTREAMRAFAEKRDPHFTGT